MQIILIYDIVNDRQRSKVATACLDYGLDRVQYSAFRGMLHRTQQQELLMRIRDIIGESPASVELYPIDVQVLPKVERLFINQHMDRLLNFEERDDDGVPRSADE